MARLEVAENNGPDVVFCFVLLQIIRTTEEKGAINKHY